MRLKLLAAATFTLLLSGCFGIGGSGNIVTQTIELENPVGSFSLAVSDSQLEIVSGDVNRLEVTTDDNLLDELELDIRGKRLALETRGNRTLHPTESIHVTLTLADVTQLYELTLAGAGDIIADQIETKQLSITLAGSGDMDLTNLNANRLRVVIAGSGDVRLSGSSDHQSIKIAGSGEYEGYDFESRTASVTIAGSGDMNLNVSHSLDVMITGSGTINVAGNPEITSKIFGSGDVNRVDW